MHQELKTIKNKIINKIISVTVLLLIPIYALSVLRTIDIGWHEIFVVHTLLLLLFLTLFFLRERLKFELKTHLLSVLFVVVGSQGLYAFGFAGAYYFCLVAILLNAILMGRKQAMSYFLVTVVIYFTIALAFLFHLIKPQVDLNQYQLYPTSWITLFFGIIYIAYVILTAAGELHVYFIKTIAEKEVNAQALKESEDRLQRIIDNIPALIFLKDKNGVYKFANKHFLNVFNIKKAVKGKTDLDLFEKEAAESFRADDKRILDFLMPEKIEETFTHLNREYTYLTQKLALKTTAGDYELLGNSIDITERKKTEEALFENEQQLQHIFDNSPAIMVLLNEKAEIIRVNRTGVEFAGKILTDALNKQFGEAFYCINSSEGEDCNNSLACKSCTLRTITSDTIHKKINYSRVEAELKMLRDGKTRSFNVLLSSSLISEKPTPIILVTIDDITAIRAAEKALMVSEERLKIAQRIGKIGHWHLDLLNNYLEWSDEVYRIFGLLPQEFEATYEAFLDRIHPEDREKVNEAYTNSLKTKKPYEITHRLLLKDGEVKYVIEKCTTDFDDNDKPLRSIGTVLDVTERVLAEKALNESEAQLKGAESLAKVGHYYYEIEKDVFHWSEEMFRILGISSNELRPTYGAFFEFIYKDDKEKLNNAFEKSLREKDVLQLEHRLTHRNGEVRYVNHKIRTEFNSKGLPIISMGAIMDITQLKQTQFELIEHKENLEQLVAKRTEELQEANKLVLEAYEELYTKNELINEQKADLEVSLNHLKEMQEQLVQSEKMASLGVLTAGVAHEINNPLNFIQGGYKGVEFYLKSKGKEHFSKVSPLLAAIGEGVNRVSDIVKGLSQFSGSDNVLIEKCEINCIIDNCLTMLYSNIRGKAKVKKNFSIDKLLVKGNIGKLHQVILNILNNAIQAIESKGMIEVSTKKNRVK